MSVLAAQRSILASPQAGDRAKCAAIALRREVDKLSGWRVKAIIDLIGEAKGNAPVPSTAQVIEALSIRDDYFNTNYFRIQLRRRHLSYLWMALSATIALVVALSGQGLFDKDANDLKQIATVVLFGILGACVSVGLGLLSADVSAKIPAQQVGAFAIWMRPAIGAGAALVALALLKANGFLQILSDKIKDDPAVVVAIAFAAGFSERFIAGAIDRVSRMAGDKKDSG